MLLVVLLCSALTKEMLVVLGPNKGILTFLALELLEVMTKLPLAVGSMLTCVTLVPIDNQ